MNSKGEKIQKFLAAAGKGSRRQCEIFIDEMRVTINGDLAERGDRVQAGDDVRLDGSRVRRAPSIFFKLYKPKGYICTDEDRHRLKRAADLLPRSRQRLFAVGRLDKDFEGLLLYTNDGDLSQRLTHPRYAIQKIYEIRISSFVTNADIEKLSKGVWLSDGRTPPLEIRVRARSKKRTVLTVNLTQNRRRLLPRIFAKLDYPFERVKRIGVGPIRLQGLKEGESKKLDAKEIKALKKLINE